MESIRAAARIGETKEDKMNRKLLWAVFAIGLALVIAPFALGLPGKSAAGQRMLNGFQPIMQPDQVATTARYYNDVFVPLGTVTPMMSAQNLAKFQAYMKGFSGTQADAAKMVPMLAAGAEHDACAGAAVDGDAATVDVRDAAEPAGDAARLRRSARHDAAERRHLLAGACWPAALSAPRHDDAGERRQLRAGEQPARLPAVLGLLRHPRCASRS